LSAIKGGRLAAACPARSLTCLLLSDVLGDDPSVIGSGPCVADGSTLAEARAIARATPPMPARVVAFLAREATATPHGLASLPRIVRVGNPDTLRAAAAFAARRAGFAPVLLPPAKDDVAACEERLARLAPGELYIGGGEPTVILRGGGRGGRCQQLALAMA